MYKVKSIKIESQQTSQYSQDIESELTKILSEELARSIDKEILRGMGFEPDKNKRRKNKIEKLFRFSE